MRRFTDYDRDFVQRLHKDLNLNTLPKVIDIPSDLIARAREGSRRDLRELHRRCAKFFISVCSSWGSYPIEEVYAACCRAMNTALTRYDLTGSQAKFSTYMASWIRAELSKLHLPLGGSVQYPDNFHWDKDKKPELQAVRYVRPDSQVDSHGDGLDWDMFSLRAPELPSFSIDLLDKMTPDLQDDLKIMKLYFGIDCEPHTLTEIATLYNRSKERIRQRIKSHSRRIKSRMDTHGIRLHDFVTN